MNAQELAEQIASILDALCEQDWDAVSGKSHRVALRALYDLDEVYQELWRENSGIKPRTWVSTGKHPRDVWKDR